MPAVQPRVLLIGGEDSKTARHFAAALKKHGVTLAGHWPSGTQHRNMPRCDAVLLWVRHSGHNDTNAATKAARTAGILAVVVSSPSLVGAALAAAGISVAGTSAARGGRPSRAMAAMAA